MHDLPRPGEDAPTFAWSLAGIGPVAEHGRGPGPSSQRTCPVADSRILSISATERNYGWPRPFPALPHAIRTWQNPKRQLSCIIPESHRSPPRKQVSLKTEQSGSPGAHGPERGAEGLESLDGAPFGSDLHPTHVHRARQAIFHRISDLRGRIMPGFGKGTKLMLPPESLASLVLQSYFAL